MLSAFMVDTLTDKKHEGTCCSDVRNQQRYGPEALAASVKLGQLPSTQECWRLYCSCPHLEYLLLKFLWSEKP